MQRTLAVLVPAAGRGRRFSRDISKVFTPLCGTPLIVRTLRALEECAFVDSITLVLGPDDFRRAERLAHEFEITKLDRIVPGGPRRLDSVKAGLEGMSGEFVMVHDGARPLITPEFVGACAEAAWRLGNSVPYLIPTDTVKEIGSRDLAGRTLDRTVLALVQTPQTFPLAVLARAYERASEEGVKATDDSALVERMGEEVHLVPGMAENIKVTHSSDVAVAEALIREREAGQPEPARLGSGEGRPRPPLVGFGVDTHRLVEGRRLVLGGVEVPHDKGLWGHSDADALIHAICDALLGAAGVGDIGRLFPDTDPRFEGVDSAILLERCVDRVREAGLCIWNVDAAVVAEAPRLSGHIPAMRERLSELLGVPLSRVSVKATTNEGLDAVGRGEGITCYAVAALVARTSGE
jgi:2-C-methyl-D-erythritol 4-phosphate cytidylyltransferase/2-C-methyl-D-erythritol 2,4-cyclodiphosphate synthase